MMGYAVRDRVEVKARLRDGTLTGKIWQVWLTELVPMKADALDQVWVATFTRNSHATLLTESQIMRKISSNFEGYNKQLQQEKG